MADIEETYNNDFSPPSPQPPPPPPPPMLDYSQMIMEAIEALNEPVGSNKLAISSYIEANYPDLPAAHSALLSHNLDKLTKSGQLTSLNDNYVQLDPNASPPTRRGRGRPPKPKVPLPPGSVPISPRPRGRPPKPRDPSAPVQSKGSSGRPRGRPPKPRDPLAPIPLVKKRAAGSSGRPRGRPPKSPMVGSSSVKRGRGRPPKTATTPASGVGVKRSRGRPPAAKSAMGAAVGGAKRGRGRLPTSITALEDQQETTYFNMFNILAVVVAVYLLAYDFVGSLSQVFDILFSVILLVLLASPLIIPAYIALKGWFESRVDVEDPDGDPLLVQEVAEDATVKSEATDVLNPEVGEMGKKQPALGEDHTIFEAFKTVDFWVLFVSFLCGVGPGLTVMNNMGQMGSALGYSDVSIFVSLLSIMGFFGRIISGSVSEYCIKKAGTPRPLFNAASQILLSVGFIVMAIAVPYCLYIGSIIVGICYGVRLAITVPIASELFGLKYYGLIYNVLILNLPIGSLLFSGLLAGFLYDAEATTTASGGDECTGAHCYRLCFIIMACACLVGSGMDIWLAIRTKNIYKRISASKRSKDCI